MQPIDYTVKAVSPIDQFTQGIRLGAGVEELKAQQAEKTAQMAAREEARKLFTNPNSTAADYARVSALLPKEQGESVRKSFEMLDTEKKNNTLSQAGQVMAAMSTGNHEVAQRLLQNQIESYTNAGLKSEADATSTYLNLYKQNPNEARNIIGGMVAAVPGGKELLENIDKMKATNRAESKAGSELAKSIADADKAVADAITAQATAVNAPEKAAADTAYQKAKAEKTRIESLYEDQKQKDELKKRAADLGLTKAQTGAAFATAKKLGAETSRITLELEALKANGGLDPQKNFEQEGKLRKEYVDRTKMYGELGSTFANLQSSAQAKTGAGDIALITGFMKMLDPGSVVRETEFATARDTAGLFDRLANTSQKLQSGQIFSLDSKQRNEYLNLAKSYMDSAQKKAAEDKKALGIIVKNYRLNPENVFGGEPATAATPTNPQNGKNIKVDY